MLFLLDSTVLGDAVPDVQVKKHLLEQDQEEVLIMKEKVDNLVYTKIRKVCSAKYIPARVMNPTQVRVQTSSNKRAVLQRRARRKTHPPALHQVDESPLHRTLCPGICRGCQRVGWLLRVVPPLPQAFSSFLSFRSFECPHSCFKSSFSHPSASGALHTLLSEVASLQGP